MHAGTLSCSWVEQGREGYCSAPGVVLSVVALRFLQSAHTTKAKNGFLGELIALSLSSHPP